MNVCATRPAKGSLAFLLACATCLPALAQGPIPAWIRGPGSAARFNPNLTQYDATNAFLAMAHGVLTGPTDIGFATFDNSSTLRAAYEARMRSILLNGNATYGSGAAARNAAGWGFDAVTFFRSAITDTEGYIASNNSYTIIAFRGSELSDLPSIVQDWGQTDFNIAPIPLIQNGTLPQGFVHRGFVTAVLSVRDQIIQQLNDSHDYRPTLVRVGTRFISVRSTKPIWCVGYSLGGACATVSAFLLSQADGLPVKGAITGGAPTVGNSGFATMYGNAGLQLFRHQNNLEVPPLAFGELTRLPGDLTGTISNVGDWIVGHFGEPLRTPMQSLLALLMAPANVVVDGIAVAGELAAMNNVNYAHFGSVRYFDRNAVMSLNPSANTRQADRVATLSAGVINVLRQFEPPAPPASLFDVNGWIRYGGEVDALVSRVGGYLLNPGALVAQLGSTFEQYVSDHSTVKIARLLHDQLPAAIANLDSMPRRP